MDKQAKIDFLRRDHFAVWCETRERIEENLSVQQPLLCVCGRLATGFHEQQCKRFNQLIDRETVRQLNHLLPKKVQR